MSTSDDEFRDPTAPPDLPEPAPQDGEDDTAGPTDAPGVDDTQVVDAGATRAIPPPPDGSTPPSYAGPTYTTPSYDRPGYEQPTYGSPFDPPPAAPPPAPEYPYGPPAAAAPTPYQQVPSQPPYQQAPYQPPYQQQPYQQGGLPAGPPTSPHPYGAPPSVYGAPQRNTSALVLTIVSGVMAVFCCSVLTVPALVFGIVGLTKQDNDPEGSRRMSRNGWIAFGVGMAVSVIAIVVFFAIGVSGGFDDSGYDSTYDGY